MIGSVPLDALLTEDTELTAKDTKEEPNAKKIRIWNLAKDNRTRDSAFSGGQISGRDLSSPQ